MNVGSNITEQAAFYRKDAVLHARSESSPVAIFPVVFCTVVTFTVSGSIMPVLVLKQTVTVPLSSGTMILGMLGSTATPRREGLRGREGGMEGGGGGGGGGGIEGEGEGEGEGRGWEEWREGGMVNCYTGRITASHPRNNTFT